MGSVSRWEPCSSRGVRRRIWPNRGRRGQPERGQGRVGQLELDGPDRVNIHAARMWEKR